jgi:hypothetical protein
MRTAHRLLSAWNVFLLLIQGIGGAFILLLALSLTTRAQFSNWIRFAEKELLLIGALVVVLTLLLLIVSMRLDRRQYYQIKMGFYGLAAEVDLDVVRTLAGRYWQLNFPAANPQVDALMRSDQTLELFVELPKIDPKEQAEVFQKIESDLGRQLARHLNYKRPFLLTVNVSK